MKKEVFASGILCDPILFDEATAIASNIATQATWQNSIQIDADAPYTSALPV